MTNTLWAEKYRPKSIDDYVGDQVFVDQIKKWIESSDIPHLLLHSFSPGTGKTTAAKMIANSIDADVLYINASDENSVDTIRDKIKGFVSSLGFKKWKIVILDESDFLTPNAQAALRNLMETFSKNSRFILTCNYVEKIIQPLVSRCSAYHIQPPDKKSVAKRVTAILKQESISFSAEDIVAVVNQYYPDQRKIINVVQDFSSNGHFTLPKQRLLTSTYCDKVIEELKSSSTNTKQKFTNIRQIIADARVRQFDDLFRKLFDTIDEWAPEGKQAMSILSIADYQYKSALVVDKEINAMALIVNLLQILK